jgi:1-acyl-sn-glycerol-3-phosphate acyltransferase
MSFIWRIWFYFLVLVATLVLLPFLFVTTLREQFYPYFFKVAKAWSAIILYGMGFYPDFKDRENFHKADKFILMANHSSMIDIMMMFLLARQPFVFVGKKELAKMPLFGYFYKRSCILVDRGDLKSRQKAFQQTDERLAQAQGVNVCIFPEGKVPDDPDITLDRFKDGPFKLAINHGLAIMPISFPDNKKRFPYKLTGGQLGRLRAFVHEPITAKGMELNLKNKRFLSQQTREAILSGL